MMLHNDPHDVYDVRFPLWYALHVHACRQLHNYSIVIYIYEHVHAMRPAAQT